MSQCQEQIVTRNLIPYHISLQRNQDDETGDLTYDRYHPAMSQVH